MRTVTYTSIVDKVATFLGQPSLNSEEAGDVNRLFNGWYRMAHEYFWWPDLMRIEKRYLRPLYNPETPYSAGAEVYYPASRKYYLCLASTTGNAPATGADYAVNAAYWAEACSDYSAENYRADKSYSVGEQVYYLDTDRFYQCLQPSTGTAPSEDEEVWGELVPFVRSLAYEQTDETVLGEIRAIWDSDPELNPAACRVPFRLARDYVLLRGPADVVWVEFRDRTPEFFGAPWAQGTEYRVGDQCFYDKNFFRAIRDAEFEAAPFNEAFWEVIPVPYIFAEYLAQSIYADLVDKSEGKQENFALEQAAGFNLLLSEVRKIERMQGQTRQLNVRR